MERQTILTYLMIHDKYKGIPLFYINRTSSYIYGQSNPTRVKDGGNGPLIYFEEVYDDVNSDLLDRFGDRYTDTMCAISSTNPLFVTNPVPEMRLNVPKFLAKKAMFEGQVEDVVLNKELYYSRNEFVLNLNERIKKQCDAMILDTQEYLCDEILCKGSINGRPLYFDGDHMSEYGNKLLIPMFKNALGNS